MPVITGNHPPPRLSFSHEDDIIPNELGVMTVSPEDD
jgi:hypothetical protein